MMNRHDLRLNLVSAIYQHLLLDKDLFNQADGLLEGKLSAEDRQYASKILYNIVQDKDSYIAKVEPLLKDWTFERLNYVEQAIILEAISELKVGEVAKAIIINEAVVITKSLCDDGRHKYINGVLDKL